MKVLIFDIKGKVAHFRKPDTTSTQLTYPFITPTAVKGIVGAILGIEDFVTDDNIGIQLLNPVRTVAQQMSMLGKETGATFNRPTTIELLVNPAYRIYYVGDEYVEKLIDFLKKDYAVYPTYLGCAYALTKPILCGINQEIRLLEQEEKLIETKTIVPTKMIKELKLKQNRHYCRAGGFMYKYKGNRTFEKSIDFIYELEGKSVSFLRSADTSELDTKIVSIGDETVCLF